ncbi:hypothetical protein K502DRAFT_348640 [Neoconidiobolus thromboides FSU 785]|nr:hypothetical protein K502DRAFT_348640 [Neoconidiobolus thromboides FSU 785]
MVGSLAEHHDIVTAIIHYSLSQNYGNNGTKHPSHAIGNKVLVDDSSVNLLKQIKRITPVDEFGSNLLLNNKPSVWKATSLQYTIVSNSLKKISYISLPE